jgi:hypothetical protein
MAEFYPKFKIYRFNHIGFHNFRILVLFLSVVLIFNLTGCLKVRLAVDVKADGSGTVGFALGMTQQAKALASSQGEDPMQILTRDLSESPSNPKDVKISRWTEGEYDWMQGEVAFQNLDELNERMARVEYFESFLITRQPGILRDRFILDARLKPLAENTSDSRSSGTLNIDPSAFIEIQMIVRLPGDIIETNGIFDGADTSKLLWTVGSKQAISVSAISETWNWMNIVVIGGGSLVAFIAIVGVILLIATTRPKRKMGTKKSTVHQANHKLPHPPSSPSIKATLTKDTSTTHLVSELRMPGHLDAPEKQPARSYDLLIRIGAHSLLQDVNHFLLKDAGKITEAPGELCLEWRTSPGSGGVQAIHIKLINQHEAAVNNQVFPATHEGMKAGISVCVREIKNRSKPS